MKSIMWKYIDEEADATLSLLNSKDLMTIAKKLTKFNNVYFVGHGSSYNACKTVAGFYSKKTKTITRCFKPYEFVSSECFFPLEDEEKTIVILISQTGTSSGVLECLELAKKYRFKTLGLSGVKNSPIGTKSDLFLDICCGEEDSNAKTKGYTCTLVTLLLLSINVGYEKKIICDDNYNTLLVEIENQINSLKTLIPLVIKWCKRYNYGENMQKLFITGHGMNYGTAIEMALKIMETTCIPTVVEDISEFSHGTHRAVDNDSHMIILVADKEEKEILENTFTYFDRIAKNCIKISVCDANSQNTINVPYAKETESVIAITAVIQIISTFVPEMHGFDPNRDANNEYTEIACTRVSINRTQ